MLSNILIFELIFVIINQNPQPVLSPDAKDPKLHPKSLLYDIWDAVSKREIGAFELDIAQQPWEIA